MTNRELFRLLIGVIIPPHVDLQETQYLLSCRYITVDAGDREHPLRLALAETKAYGLRFTISMPQEVHNLHPLTEQPEAERKIWDIGDPDLIQEATEYALAFFKQNE